MVTASKQAPATLRDYKERMLRVLVHIQQHLDAALCLEELAAVACFSPYHFHRVFSGMIGESVQSHVRRLRLERAATRLKLSPWPVTQIALEAGYASPEAFTRAFKAAFRVSPSRFRSRAGLVATVAPAGIHYHPDQPLRGFRTTPPGGFNMKVKLERLPDLPVAFMRHVGTYAEVGATWDRLLLELGRLGYLGGDARFIGLCHDDPEVTPADKLRYDACVSVATPPAVGGDLGFQTIPGGLYAVTTHFGAYAQLGLTYAQLLGRWLPRSGYALRSTPCLEMYLNDPHSTDPADLLTDIYAPLSSVGTGPGP